MERLVVLALAVLTACNPVDQDGGKNSKFATLYSPEELTEPCGEQPRIQLADVGCSIEGYRFYVETTGWVGRARINIWELVEGNKFAGRVEEHTMDSFEFDPACGWDHLERVLAQGATDYTYMADQNTAFLCDIDPNPPDTPDDRPGLTYAVRVYDQNLSFSHCWMWGAHIEEVLADPAGVGVGDVPNNIEITDSAQLTACDVILQ